eukprot:g22053.t1
MSIRSISIDELQVMKLLPKELEDETARDYIIGLIAEAVKDGTVGRGVEALEALLSEALVLHEVVTDEAAAKGLCKTINKRLLPLCSSASPSIQTLDVATRITSAPSKAAASLPTIPSSSTSSSTTLASSSSLPDSALALASASSTASTSSTSSESSSSDAAFSTSRCEQSYFSCWSKELASAGHRSVPGWDAEELARFVESLEPDSKKGGLLSKIAKMLRDEDVSGALLLAAGPSLIVEKSMSLKLHKQQSVLKVTANKIFKKLEELQETSKRGDLQSYWQLLQIEGNKEEQELITTFPDRAAMNDALFHALSPQPRSRVTYGHVQQDSKLDVNSVCKVVRRRFTPVVGSSLKSASNGDQKKQKGGKKAGRLKKGERTPAEEWRFLVVSASTDAAPELVAKNFIFYVHTTEATPEWQPLCSVDFVRHGTAPPGHWHLNRTSDGDVMQHWGDGGSVFHGRPEMCPVWWLLIPDGTEYLNVPKRHFDFTAS